MYKFERWRKCNGNWQLSECLPYLISLIKTPISYWAFKTAASQILLKTNLTTLSMCSTFLTYFTFIIFPQNKPILNKIQNASNLPRGDNLQKLSQKFNRSHRMFIWWVSGCYLVSKTCFPKTFSVVTTQSYLAESLFGLVSWNSFFSRIRPIWVFVIFVSLFQKIKKMNSLSTSQKWRFLIKLKIKSLPMGEWGCASNTK